MSDLRRAHRLLAALPLLAGIAACSSVESRPWFVPERSVHRIVLEQPTGSADLAEVTARLLEVMRAADDQPRRLHARLDVRNLQDEPLTVPLADATLATSLPAPLAADRTGEIAVPGHEGARVDLYFPLPERRQAPADLLDELTLHWVLVRGGRRFASQAAFRRAPEAWRAWPEPYGYGGWSVRYGFGPPWGWWGYCPPWAP